MMKQWIGLVAMMMATTTANGDPQVLAHYRLGEGQGITYAVGPEVFQGDIHEVRLNTFDPGTFDPDAHLLLDYTELRARGRVERARQAERIAALAEPSTGVRVVDAVDIEPVHTDWLVTPVTRPAEMLVQPSADGQTARLVLQNGLVSREFHVSENLACVSYRLHSLDAQFLRAVKPEVRVQLDGAWYEVGGLKGQPEKSYLLEAWLPDMTGDPRAFQFVGMETRRPEARYPWTQKFNAVRTPWPPKGLRVDFHFEAPESVADAHRHTRITVHYELYEGLPVLAKWFTLENASGSEIRVDAFEGEVLAVAQDQVRRLHAESDYAFALSHVHPEGSALLHFQGTPKPWQAGRGTTKWRLDPEYDTWATQNPTEESFMGRDFRCLMVSTPPLGPGAALGAEETFESFTTFELLNDSDDRERRTLGQRRLYRTLAPQVTEDLLCFGISAYDFAQLKPVIDQMAELGFEALNLMAWPGIDHVNLDPAYVANLRKISDYAAERGIVVGGYELWIASRGRGEDVNCIHPDTGKPGSLFGQSVCVASSWWDEYTRKMWAFFDQTGIRMTLFDGPYHGDPCASTEHRHHRGLEDSQWRQWQLQVAALHEFQRRGFSVPLPEWYFLNGQAATGMGYREASANLSPQQQLLLGRQYIYDGTWHKTPTMGWMSLQLVGFYTSDPRVGLEPLADNIDRYERGLAQYLASGCQFTLRGNRIYDTPEVKAMVQRWMDWRRKHRAILTSDIVHLGRPTGRDLDCVLHVNAQLETKGLAVVFNPTNRRIRKDVVLPLYYTGLTDTATVREQEGGRKTYTLDRAYRIRVPLDVEANGSTWLVVEL